MCMVLTTLGIQYRTESGHLFDLNALPFNSVCINFISVTLCNVDMLDVASCSYKLWYNYLRLRRTQVKGKCVTDGAYEDVNNAFERALVFMHKVRYKKSHKEHLVLAFLTIPR